MSNYFFKEKEIRFHLNPVKIYESVRIQRYVTVISNGSLWGGGGGGRSEGYPVRELFPRGSAFQILSGLMVEPL